MDAEAAEVQLQIQKRDSAKTDSDVDIPANIPALPIVKVCIPFAFFHTFTYLETFYCYISIFNYFYITDDIPLHVLLHIHLNLHFQFTQIYIYAQLLEATFKFFIYTFHLF